MAKSKKPHSEVHQAKGNPMSAKDRANAASLLEIAERIKAIKKPVEVVWIVPRGFCDSIPRFTEIERAALSGLCPHGVQVIESEFVDRPSPIPRWVMDEAIINLDLGKEFP